MPSTANPILDTVETIPGYPSILKLFKCAESRYWQVGCYLAGRSIRKTTKTEQKALAVKFAKKFFQELLLKQSQNLPLTQSPTFEIIAEDLFKEDQGRVDRGERSPTLVTDARYIYEADLLKFFHRNHVKDITYQRLNDYVAHLKTRGKKPVGSTTVKHHLILLNKILKHAHKLGYIDRLPVFPTVIAKDNPREYLTDEQYDNLLKVIDKEIEKRAVVRYVPVTAELRHLVVFMTNSFLRPPDIKNLTNKQITKAKSENIEFLRIAAVSKVKASTVVTMPLATTIYEQLTKMHTKRGFGKPDDYVFFPAFKRDHAMKIMNLQFNHVLNLSGLKEGPNGATRTLYSLRHTCIMKTLLRSKNLNLLTLARNCRTSVDMIERFYASQLTAEMNVDQLHSTKNESKKPPAEPEIYKTFDELYLEDEASSREDFLIDKPAKRKSKRKPS